MEISRAQTLPDETYYTKSAFGSVVRRGSGKNKLTGYAAYPAQTSPASLIYPSHASPH